MFGNDVGSIEYDARINTSKLRTDAAESDAIVRSTGDSVERTGEKSFGAFGTWAKVGLLAAGAATVALGVSAFKTGVEYNTLQQTSRAALKTILGSTEAASDQMNKLNEFVRQSPFAKDIFIKAQQQLLGFGVSADKVIPTLSSIQDAVAAIGGSSADIAVFTDIFSSIQGNAKLSGEELSRFGDKGIDAATIIGSQMGKTGAEIRAMASRPGGIPIDEMWDPLVNGLSGKFGGAADNVKNTWAGTADRIGAAFRDLGSKIAAPFVNPDGGGAAIEWGNKFADFIRALPEIMAPFLSTLNQLYTWFSVNILPILQDFVNFMNTQLKQAWIDITAALAPFISQSDLIKVLLFALLVPIALVVAAIVIFVGIIAVVVAAIARLIGWIVQASSWFIQLQNSVYSAMGSFIGSIVGAINSAIGWFNRLQSSIVSVFSGAGGWLISAGQNIVNGLINGIKSAIGGAVNAASDLASSVTKAAQNALNIHSPSRVFADIGKNVVLGFAQGIDNNAALAGNSMGNMLGSVGAPGMSSTSGSLGSLDSAQMKGGNSIVNNINSITIGSEVDADRVIRRLTGDQEIIQKGLVPQTSYA